MRFLTRREVLPMIGSSVILSSTAGAQSIRKTPTIGILWHAGTVEEEAVFLNAFKQGLNDLGYTDGQNIRLINTFANEEYERFNKNADDLVQQKVDAIYAVTLPAALAAQRATKTIPVVCMLVADPIAAKLVASISRPGGNITGFSALSEDLAAKRVEIFREMIPTLSQVAVLTNPSDPFGARRTLDETRAAASRLNITVQSIEARTRTELPQVIATVNQSVQGIILQADPLFFVERAQITELALKQRLPIMGFNAQMANSGALLSYAPNILGIFRRSATYVDKIVKGARPADLPIELPTRFEFFVNLKTARALNLNIPESLLVRADKVIE